MSQPNFILSIPANDTKLLQSGLQTVRFQSGETALLNASSPLASIYTRRIGFAQERNRPLYVQVDSTNTITDVFLPLADRVWEVNETAESIRISLYRDAAIHFLRRDHPQFNEMYAVVSGGRGTPVLVTSTTPDNVIVDLRVLPADLKLTAPEEEETDTLPPAPAPTKPITPAKAQELFALMAARDCVPCNSQGSTCIPFKYPASGCWIRAHLMAFIALRQWVTPQKIWNFKGGWAHTANDPKCRVNWSFHVALTIDVMKSAHETETMVFDPSLFTEPVSLARWAAEQHVTISDLTPTDWEQYGRGGEADETKAEHDMEEFRGLLDDMCRKDGAPPYKQCGMP